MTVFYTYKIYNYKFIQNFIFVKKSETFIFIKKKHTNLYLEKKNSFDTS